MYRVRELLNSLRSSFWFMPALIVAASIGLAVALVTSDSVLIDRWLAHWPRLFGARPEGARQLLATVAGSMMTVMGVTFSMTLVALSLASSQYTSRILRNFMRSRVTQCTLGIFAGIFTYCLIVLHTVRSGVGEAAFVPGLALFGAFIFALGGVGVLIYFIHHIASSIQASTIIAAVARETIAVIERSFPERLALDPETDDDETHTALIAQPWQVVLAKADGYIQGVNAEALMQVAHDQDAIVRMEGCTGEFLVRGAPLVAIALTDAPDAETATRLHSAFSIGSHRTVDQDPAFGVRQIVDIALKALSPGVNDTSTAVICVDYLTAILARIAQRECPPLRWYDGDVLRVIALGPTFDTLLGAAFDQIRRQAAGNVAIMSRLLGAIATIGSQTDLPRRRSALHAQAQKIADMVERNVDAEGDRTRLEMKQIHVRRALEAGPDPAGRK